MENIGQYMATLAGATLNVSLWFPGYNQILRHIFRIPFGGQRAATRQLIHLPSFDLWWNVDVPRASYGLCLICQKINVSALAFKILGGELELGGELNDKMHLLSTNGTSSNRKLVRMLCGCVPDQRQIQLEERPCMWQQDHTDSMEVCHQDGVNPETSPWIDQRRPFDHHVVQANRNGAFMNLHRGGSAVLWLRVQAMARGGSGGVMASCQAMA
ncbi:hypothetical protein Tco_0586659 [Tanacetum coccineum]